MSDSPPSIAPVLPPVKRSRLPIVLIVLAVVMIALGAAWWWYWRPIQPVTLTAVEKTAVEAKVEVLEKPAEPTYEKGAREIVLTERELNGLLNENTTLGKSLSFQLATDAIHARIETDLDADLPVVGGKRLKARARFVVGDGSGHPTLVLEDLTVWGISVPNDWLAGIKGRDLLGEALGGGNKSRTTLAGVEELRVEPGQLRIRLKE